LSILLSLVEAVVLRVAEQAVVEQVVIVQV
jgi:hypothetical protein